MPTGLNWVAYPDFFTFEVPSNSEVTALNIQIDLPDVWTGIGNPAFSNYLANDQNTLSGELLSQWGLSSIGPGVYGMYLENHDSTILHYYCKLRTGFRG